MKPCAFLFAAALALPAFTFPAAAQQGRLTINLHGAEKQASEVSQVTLDGDMLRMALHNDKNATPEAQQVLSHLQGIYIQDLEFKQPGQYPASIVQEVENQLSKSDWHTIVRDTSAKEQTWIAVQRNSEMITAIAIFDAAPKELSIVNIVGPLPNGLASLSALGSLGGAMGKMGKLGKLGKIDGSAAATPPPPAAH